MITKSSEPFPLSNIQMSWICVCIIYIMTLLTVIISMNFNSLVLSGSLSAHPHSNKCWLIIKLSTSSWDLGVESLIVIWGIAHEHQSSNQGTTLTVCSIWSTARIVAYCQECWFLQRIKMSNNLQPTDSIIIWVSEFV